VTLAGLRGARLRRDCDRNFRRNADGTLVVSERRTVAVEQGAFRVGAG